MNLASARTEQVYVSRGVRKGLETLALFHAAAQPEGAECPSIAAFADGLADNILREYLDTVPQLQAKRRDVHKALAAIDAKYAQEKP